MEEFIRLGEVADLIMPTFDGRNRVRMPVLNHEPRLIVGKMLWAGMWHRDGGRCWICGRWAQRAVADHVRPRSNWPAEELELADRSDNLRVACWDCNTMKSNFDYTGGDNPLGIAIRCTNCQRTDSELMDELCGEGRVRCYCFKCGMGGLVQSAHLFLRMQEPEDET